MSHEQYFGHIDAEDVGGFDYETGRSIDDDGYFDGKPDETAVISGDFVEIESGECHMMWRVVEAAEDCILCFGPYGPLKEHIDDRLEVKQWDDIVSKEDPRDRELSLNDVPLPSIERKRNPSDD